MKSWTKEEVEKNFLCKDCEVDTKQTGEYYMVHNHIWLEAGMSLKFLSGMLCINDLERRLGRRLKLDDFTGAPVNGIFFHRVGVDRFI